MYPGRVPGVSGCASRQTAASRWKSSLGVALSKYWQNLPKNFDNLSDDACEIMSEHPTPLKHIPPPTPNVESEKLYACAQQRIILKGGVQ